MYKLINLNLNPYDDQENIVIKRLGDNACIPINEDNVDYRAYLRWLEEGNQPEPADEPSQG